MCDRALDTTRDRLSGTKSTRPQRSVDRLEIGKETTGYALLVINLNGSLKDLVGEFITLCQVFSSDYRSRQKDGKRQPESGMSHTARSRFISLFYSLRSLVRRSGFLFRGIMVNSITSHGEVRAIEGTPVEHQGRVCGLWLLKVDGCGVGRGIELNR